MKTRIDPLIAERAPWLFSQRPGMGLARSVLNKLLRYDETLDLAETLRDMPADRIMRYMGERLARHVTVQGLGHVPRSGPALVVANHPTGIADGVILHHLLSVIRPDMYFFANTDILRVLPQMRDCICPVEWRQEKRTHAKTRATLDYTRAAVAQGRLGVIFPSGRLAKRQGLSLCERPWMPSAATLARRFDLPVVPIHIRARNSALFYALDKIEPTLRDITLFHETLNKNQHNFSVTIGPRILPRTLPRMSEDGIACLRDRTLALAKPEQSHNNRWRYDDLSQTS